MSEEAFVSWYQESWWGQVQASQSGLDYLQKQFIEENFNNINIDSHLQISKYLLAQSQ